VLSSALLTALDHSSHRSALPFFAFLNGAQRLWQQFVEAPAQDVHQQCLAQCFGFHRLVGSAIGIAPIALDDDREVVALNLLAGERQALPA
jgi:hypothetical protein